MDRLRSLAAICVMLCCAAARADVRSVEVTFEGSGGFELRGTLALPDQDPELIQSPGVLLLGAWSHDRDGNARAHYRPDMLRLLAEGLAEAGIASFRYDQRTLDLYSDSWPEDVPSSDEFFGWQSIVGDARAAQAFLRNRPEVDSARVAVLGFGDGGLTALQLCSDLSGSSEAPAGVILIAMGARAGGEDLVTRMRQLRRSADDEALLTQQHLEDLEALLRALEAGDPLPTPSSRDFRFARGKPYSMLHTMLVLDPAELAQTCEGPVLLMQGEYVELAAPGDLELLESALRSRDSGEVEVVVVRRASRHLKHMPPHSAGTLGPILPRAKRQLVEWIDEHVAGDPGPP